MQPLRTLYLADLKQGTWWKVGEVGNTVCSRVCGEGVPETEVKRLPIVDNEKGKMYVLEGVGKVLGKEASVVLKTRQDYSESQEDGCPCGA